MWSFSEAGRKFVISFINNMMSLVAILSVFMYVVARIELRDWQSYVIMFSICLVMCVATVCNVIEFMEAPSKSDPRLRRMKKLSAAMYKGGAGFRSSLVLIRFAWRRRKLRVLESIVLAFLLSGVMLIVLVAAMIATPK